MQNNKKSRNPDQSKPHDIMPPLSPDDFSPRYFSLETLVAGTWINSVKRGTYSYQLKKQYGSETPANMIKIVDLDVSLVGIIKSDLSTVNKSSDNLGGDARDQIWKNAVIISMHGPPFKCAVADERLNTHLLSENLIAISMNNHIPAAYISAYLNSAKGQKEFEKYAPLHSPIVRINENQLKLIEIPLLPDEVCDSVYSWFETAYHYECTLNHERIVLSQLATGIIQAISGELQK